MSNIDNMKSDPTARLLREEEFGAVAGGPCAGSCIPPYPYPDHHQEPSQPAHHTSWWVGIKPAGSPSLLAGPAV